MLKQDINKSIKHFEIAANQNYPKAMFYSVLIYYEGIYIKQNVVKSIQYFISTADKYEPNAQYNLGLIY